MGRYLTKIRQNGPPGRYAESGVVAGIGTRMSPWGCDLRANCQTQMYTYIPNRIYIYIYYMYTQPVYVYVWDRYARIDI